MFLKLFFFAFSLFWAGHLAGATPPPQITREQFLSFQTVSEMLQVYRNLGHTGDKDAIIERAKADYHDATRETAIRQLLKAPPSTFEPIMIDVVIDPLQVTSFYIYGYNHGIAPPHYKDFVERGLQQHAGSIYLFEQHLAESFSTFEGTTIDMTDHYALTLIQQIRHYWPLIWQNQKERPYKIEVNEPMPIDENDDQAIAAIFRDAFSLRLHNLDLEAFHLAVRSALPVALTSELIYSGPNTFDRLVFLRSIYMAGFAYGTAVRTKASKIVMAMGRAHESEVWTVLKNLDRWRDAPAFQMGYDHGLNPSLFQQHKKAVKTKYMYLKRGLDVVHTAVFAIPMTVLLYMLFSKCAVLLEH